MRREVEREFAREREQMGRLDDLQEREHIKERAYPYADGRQTDRNPAAPRRHERNGRSMAETVYLKPLPSQRRTSRDPYERYDKDARGLAHGPLLTADAIATQAQRASRA